MKKYKWTNNGMEADVAGLWIRTSDLKSLPPAEGAEEILEKHISIRGLLNSGNYSCVGIPYEDAIKAIRATLHAQQIAEGAEERLREVTERCKKLKFMIDKGLGWDDMKNDITMPHEL
jgi:hypothetical protein